MNANSIARRLKKAGFTVQSVSDDDPQQYDAEITISGSVYVQVGHNYMVVNEHRGDTFYCDPPRTTVAAVVADLRKRLPQAGVSA